jgi:hypothetical protein
MPSHIERRDSVRRNQIDTHIGYNRKTHRAQNKRSWGAQQNPMPQTYSRAQQNPHQVPILRTKHLCLEVVEDRTDSAETVPVQARDNLAVDYIVPKPK